MTIVYNKVAIVGGSGFIGCNLANYLAIQNYKVLVIGRHFDKDKYTSENISFKTLDANFTNNLLEITKEYANVIWLINSLVPSTSMDSLIDNYTHNVTPLVKYLELCSQTAHYIKKFVFLSSGGTVYGNPPFGTNALPETAEQNPISAYGLSKQIAENYVKYLSSKCGFISYILRPSNVYGIHQNLQKPQGVIGYAFNSIKNNTAIYLYDDGKVIRDFIHVSDLSYAIQLCLEQQRYADVMNHATYTYNVSSKIEKSIKSIIQLISQTTGKEVKIIHKPPREFDCYYNVLDNSKIKQDLDWKCKVDLKIGLQDMWLWFSTTRINTELE